MSAEKCDKCPRLEAENAALKNEIKRLNLLLKQIESASAAAYGEAQSNLDNASMGKGAWAGYQSQARAANTILQILGKGQTGRSLGIFRGLKGFRGFR